MCLKKKVLFISRTLRGGGAERFISTFASYMADKKYDIALLVYEEHIDDYPLSTGIKKYVMPQRGTSLLDKLKRIYDMYKMINIIQPFYIIPFVDTVVICSFFANIFIKKKFIYTVRVSPWHEKLIGSKIKNYLRRIIAKKSDAIMVQTHEQKEFFSKEYLKKIFVVPNPIPRKFYNLKKNYLTGDIINVCMLGRLDKQKNFPLAIQAISELHNKYPKLRLNIYGEGIEKDFLNQEIRKNNAENICNLKGRTATPEVVLKGSDIFLLTSDFEGMPNSLIEAMAIGLPCIATNCKTGPSDLISNNKNGFLINVGNKDELKNRLSFLLDNPHKAKEMGRSARNFVLYHLNIENTRVSFLNMLFKVATP